MTTLKNKHPSRSGLLFDRRWGHPLLGFARFLAGVGFWISHVVIVVGVVSVLLLTWFECDHQRDCRDIGDYGIWRGIAFRLCWVDRPIQPLIEERTLRDGLASKDACECNRAA